MERRKIKAPIKKEKKHSTKRKIIVTVILLTTAFSGAFLIYFIMQLALNTNNPMVVVVSGSMEPNLHKGDLLFLRGIDAENIRNGTIEGKEGDIIVFDAQGLPGWFHAPPEPIVHRVVDKKYDNGWFFLTKGDANHDADPVWVPETRIFGVVVGRIPYIGWVKIILTDSGLLIPLLVIVSFLLVISVVWDIVKKDKDETGSDDEKRIYDEKEFKQEIEIDFTKTEKS
ncbi:MAG: signal peptidase I [Promethearchaeota archaeon]|jgi:signal peptidase